MRISAYIAKKYNISRRAAKESIFAGLIAIDGQTAKNDIEFKGEKVEYYGTENIPNFNVNDYLISIYPDTIFLYKPPFMHSDRLRPYDSITVSDIMKTFPDYRSISRLDYETDGIIGAVRYNKEINYIQKKYIAIVEGVFPDILIADWFIDADKKRKVRVDERKKGNKTIMKNIFNNNNFSLIEVVIEKASRHQIRAFCAHIGNPIRGDKLYGGKDFFRLCLHCKSVAINNDSAHSGKYYEQFSELIYK